MDDSKKKKLDGTTMMLDGSIKLGDVISRVNGVEVGSDLNVYDVLEGLEPGDEVSLDVLKFSMEGGKREFIPRVVKITV